MLVEREFGLLELEVTIIRVRACVVSIRRMDSAKRQQNQQQTFLK
jgi:hypothetical protein